MAEKAVTGRQTLADLHAVFERHGTVVEQVRVMLHRRELRQTRAGRDYEVLLLGDATMNVEARDFKLSVSRAGHPPYLNVTLKLEEYNGAVSAIVERADPIAEPVDPAEFMAIDEALLARTRREFDAALDSLRPGSPCQLLMNALFDARTRKQFFLWPAASKHHHNYPGGLAEHTLEVHRYAHALAQADDLPYDSDLLTAGCLIHDIGKLDEYAQPPMAGRSTAGHLAYHLAFAHLRLGMAVTQARQAGADIPESTVWQLMHLTEQSHGAHRLDQSRTPIGKEARCLAAADDHSAKLTAGQVERQTLTDLARTSS